MAKSTRKNETAAAELRAIVDELGAIEKELAPIKGKIKRAELLRKSLREKTPDSTNQIDGDRFVAMLGEHGLKTIVDYRELVRRIGAPAYAKFATATQDALTQHVPAAHLAHCLSQEQSGPRSLTIVERGVAQ